MRISFFYAIFLIAFAWPCLQGELVHRWSFNSTVGSAPAGTFVADSVGTANGQVVGQGAAFNGDSLVLPGNTNGNQTPANIAAYVDLPNGLISSKTHLSVEIWATPVSIKFWQRLFDFGRMGTLSTNVRGPGALNGEILPTATAAPNNAVSSDDFSLAVNRENNANTQRIIARLDGATERGTNTGAALATGIQHHIVCTYTQGAGTLGTTGGQMAWYLNGTLVNTLDVNFRLSAIQDRNNWLGRSMYTADSNSNISYNEVRLYDHALTPEEIADHIAAGPDSLGGGPDNPPVPDHLWVFNNDADSTVSPGLAFTDSIGGRIATLKGNGAALTGTAVRLPGSTNGNQSAATISAYLDLPNGILTGRSALTFEAWATPLSSKNWQRLFEFGRCVASHGSGAAPGEILDDSIPPGFTAGYDNISLTLNNAGDLNTHQLEGQYDGNAPQYTTTTAATVAGTRYHYVFVIEDGAGVHGAAGCQVRWYRDGVLQNSDDFAFRAAEMENVNNWIGRSMYSGDSNSHLALDELRIYQRVLSAGEILASNIAGPDPGAGAPEPPVPPQVPESRWSFNNAPAAVASGSAFTDATSGESATVRGNGATLNGTALVLPGTSTGNQSAANISAYLDLRNGVISSRPSLSFEAWITPLSSKNWQRVFDFGKCTITSGSGAATGEIIDGPAAPGFSQASDNLMLSNNKDNALGSHRMDGMLNNSSVLTVDTDLSGSTTAGTEYHYVLTVQDGAGTYGSAGCQVKWYRNGEVQGSADLAFRLTDMQDVNNWIGRSQWAGDSNAHMRINELRLYNRALSIGEVISSFTNGPNTAFPAPVAVNDAATIHPGQKVLINVLANDTNSPNPNTLQIITPPSSGSATVTNGKILYTHSGPANLPLGFTYRVGNSSGFTSSGTVTIDFATSLRLTNPALAMPAALPATSWQLVDALPGLTFNRPICLTSIPGDANQLYVSEQGGVIRRVADVTSLTPITNVFLDITTLGAGFDIGPFLAGQPENGLLGLAFHPQYATNGYFYVAYTANLAGNYFQRVSRFSRHATDPTIANPASELILLQIDDFGFNHNGGDLHFSPVDGYLYYGTGDGENSTAGQAKSQRINDDFYSGIFRIDVDKRPGSLPPNPHPSIPTDGGAARFNVPPDNPFVHTSLNGTWNGSYNGINYSASLSTVRTEFWATGIRHAWRMSFDPLTGDLWEGDVGQDTYEEINKIQKGGNYGWAYREGAHNFNGILGAAPAGFTSIDPVYEYVHTAVPGGSAEFKGNSVVGGHVYRGTRFPSLAGRYVFSDSISGHVWEMNTANGTTTRLTGLPGAYGVISTQGVDPSTKDLLFAAYLSGKIMRLATGDAPNQEFPATLTATGLFADLTDLSPAPGLLPYAPNLPFWSDHALKQRWFTIPDATSKMTWNKNGNWTYPTGTVWVKHFDLELSRGNPATKKRIETRVLVKTGTGSYGVSYRWNEAQTEAFLVEDAGAEFDLAINDHGTPKVQRWQIPARSSCLTCHTPQGGHALSFNTRQLNRDETILGYSGNQLKLLAENHFLHNTPDPVATLERHVRPGETQYPLEQRVRSYFDVNCAYCHQTGGSVGGLWDGRAQLTLEQTGLINGTALNNGGNPLNRYIVPGDTGHSIILHRMAGSNGSGRMPPLGTTELDTANIQLISDWISGELPDRPLYNQWRDSYFSAIDPENGKSDDPDHDGVSNYDEYLRGTSPLSGANPWQATISNGMLRFNRQAHRYYGIEISDDLTTWTPWNLPEIDSNYQAEDEITEIPLPEAPGGEMFFRFQMSEP